MKHLEKKIKVPQNYLKLVASSIPSRIFWWSFVLLLVIHCIENTSVIYSDAVWLRGVYLFRNFLYLVLLVKICLLSVFRKNELVCVILIGVAGLGSVLGSGDFGLLEYFIIMLAAREESPRRLVAVFAMIKGAAIIITLFLWRIGVLAAMYYQDDKVGYYNTYGFCHRNVLAANVTVLCFAWFYLRYKSLQLWDVIVWTVIALITFRYAISRTGMIVIFLVIFGIFFVRKKRGWILKVPYFRTVLLVGFVAMLLVSVLGTLLYSDHSAFWNFIDNIFTKRFRYANYCFNQFGLSFFGQKIPFVSSMEAQTSDTAKLILDNSFMRALLYYGMIPGGLFLAIYFKALYHSLKNKNEKLAVCLFIFAVYGLSERYMLDAYYQFPLWIAWNKYFFKKKGVVVEERKTFVEYLLEMFRFCKGKM